MLGRGRKDKPIKLSTLSKLLETVKRGRCLWSPVEDWEQVILHGKNHKRAVEVDRTTKDRVWDDHSQTSDGVREDHDSVD